MTDLSFRTELKNWMVGRRQKEAAAFLGVEVRTLVGWLGGYHEPYAGPTRAEILRKIREHSEEETV